MEYCLEIFILVCCCLAGIVNSLPIPSAHPIGDQKALLFGVLAFISVGAFLGACVCCRRRKRGFEEFENESGGLESARTEYPIFRAISSPERSNPQNESIIQVANAHIIGINENNIQINEEVDNNNGPLSPMEMENIENNNAVDYIPNRNEIERLVEPASISFEQEQQQSQLFDRSNPFIERISQFDYDESVANPNNPFVIVNDNDANLIIIPDGNQSHENALVIESDCQIKSSINLLEEAVSMESSLSEKSFTDVNSVEEALRALDFAISGEESLLQPNDDYFESNDNEDVKSNICVLNDFLANNDVNDVDYDYSHLDTMADVRKKAEFLVNSVIEECEHRIAETNKPIEEFQGDELLNKTTNDVFFDKPIDVNLVDYQVTTVNNGNELFFRNATNEINRTIDLFENSKSANKIENEIQQNFDCSMDAKQNNPIESSISDEINLTKDFQSVGSVENLCFENIVLEASTPFIKSKVGKMKKYFSTDSPSSIDSPESNATFDIHQCSSESDVFESPTVNDIKQINETIACNPLEPLSNAGHIDSTFTQADGTFVKETANVGPINSTFTQEADGTFVKELANAGRIDSTFTQADGTFLKEPEVEQFAKIQVDCPVIKIDTEDSTSVDMTTVTPVNTPIELSYSLDSWDKFISNSMTQQVIMPKDTVEMQPCTSAQAALADASSGWFLHPKGDGLPSDNDLTDCSIYFDAEEESEENMNSTFDALRKQLAIMLPHAQGVTEHPPDFSDDDDEDTDEKLEHRSPSDTNIEPDTPHTEMLINYKRPLSPIMEESEDETCKTFVMNETKNLDSTSTGCVETGEAIMGVTKTLMASNDTLFNFEDTLGDDVFSPRANSQNDIIKDYKTIYPDSSGASTPTPRSFKPMEFESIEICNVNDLLSPDQQKTLSEDICTVEHLSSDAVDTTFTTNTLEEKTCISVYIKEDEKISEISEPDWGGSSNQCDLNSLNDVPSMGILDNDDEQTQCNDVENDESSSTVSTTPKNDEKNEHDDPNVENVQSFHRNDDDESYKDKTSNFLRNEINYSSSHYVKSSDIFGNPMIYDNIKENTDPNTTQQYDDNEASLDHDKNSIFHAKNLTESGIFEGDLLCETDVIMRNSTFHPADITIDLNKHQSIIPNFTLCEIDTQGDPNCVMVATEIINHLSGEEDPWAHPMSDIRFTGPCAEIMTTSFTANEWDSDVDDSNSSEEFMYVKGTPPKVPSPELYKQKLENKHEKKSIVPIIVEEDIGSVWNSHEDKVPVAVKEIVEMNLEHSEDSSSDAEGEWVPSCWDSLAQPSRSALKSPDKSSSSPKKQRSVAFKKQNYHSVYEYPKEVVALSPSYSEPQLWARDLNDLFDKHSEPVEIKVTETDGFNVSSSTRPFHGSQFNAQCHTWPTDSNFSWSQIQDNESNNDKYPSYSELQIKWPKDLRDFLCSEETQDNSDIELARPDSGVGESAELLSDSITLGDLCHTKASLRLPLNNVPAVITGETKKITDLLHDQSMSDMVDHNNLILPTPSCTGSMDSLSSSSGSERQISFSTFGKSISISFDDDRINESDGKSELITIDDDKQREIQCPIIKMNHERSTKQSDSTDEDSGIESIMRIASEKM